MQCVSSGVTVTSFLAEPVLVLSKPKAGDLLDTNAGVAVHSHRATAALTDSACAAVPLATGGKAKGKGGRSPKTPNAKVATKAAMYVCACVFGICLVLLDTNSFKSVCGFWGRQPNSFS